jgi:3-oxoacyl-[acyl-carrier protein] reductase
MNLTGIRAIVTGAAGGIGLATVKSLLQGGASRVGLLAHNERKIENAMTAIDSAEERGRVVPLLADVREPETLSKAFESFLRTAGGLEVLVNNAGVLLDGALLSFSFRGVQRYSLENWQTTMETNLRGVFLCSQLAVEHMFRKRCKGVIVNITSISRQGRAGQTAYSASKGGIASLTFTLAQELAPYGIRCTAIAPGLVDTPMAANIPEEARKKMLEHVAVGRMGRPAEIAHGVLFCIENDFFNGRVLELDGGAFGG